MSRKSILPFIAVTLLLAGCDLVDPERPFNENAVAPPVVTWTGSSLQDGDTVHDVVGFDISNGSAPFPIAGVALFVNSELATTRASSPFSVEVQTNRFANGPATLTVGLFDATPRSGLLALAGVPDLSYTVDVTISNHRVDQEWRMPLKEIFWEDNRARLIWNESHDPDFEHYNVIWYRTNGAAVTIATISDKALLTYKDPLNERYFGGHPPVGYAVSVSKDRGRLLGLRTDLAVEEWHIPLPAAYRRMRPMIRNPIKSHLYYTYSNGSDSDGIAVVDTDRQTLLLSRTLTDEFPNTQRSSSSLSLDGEILYFLLENSDNNSYTVASMNTSSFDFTTHFVIIQSQMSQYDPFLVDDAGRLFIASRDGTLRVFDMSNGSHLSSLALTFNHVWQTDMLLSPDQTTIYTAAAGHSGTTLPTIYKIDIQDFQPQLLEQREINQKRIRRMALSGDGEDLYVMHSGGQGSFWAPGTADVQLQKFDAADLAPGEIANVFLADIEHIWNFTLSGDKVYMSTSYEKQDEHFIKIFELDRHTFVRTRDWTYLGEGDGNLVVDGEGRFLYNTVGNLWALPLDEE